MHHSPWEWRQLTKMCGGPDHRRQAAVRLDALVTEQLLMRGSWVGDGAGFVPGEGVGDRARNPVDFRKAEAAPRKVPIPV